MEHPASSTSLEPPETYRSIVARLPERSDLSDHPASVFRHTGWAHHRRKVYDAFQRLDLGIDRIWNFTQCGKHAYVVQSPDDPSVYRITGSTCHDRFCLPCANSRSHTIALNVLDRIQDRETRFITLTMHSTTEALSPLLDLLLSSFARLRKRRQWAKRVWGGVAFLELKWSDAGDRWNVHLHLLAEGKYYRTGMLSKLWLEITGKSKVVDLALVKNPAIAARYVTQYASKPLHPSVIADPARLDEAILALKGRRLCTTFGTWRGLKLTESPSENAWTYVATLEDLISRALDGEPEAVRICNSLGVPDVIAIPPARSPPTPTPPVVPRLVEEQQVFDRNWDRGRHNQWD